MDRTIEYMKDSFGGLIFTNLVDYDMLYGHRNDIEGYAGALREFDRRLPELLDCLKDGDILMITADHGCDPTTESTDHSREYVPLVVYGRKLKSNINLGTRETFSDIAATVAEYLGTDGTGNGTSFYGKIAESV
jgi:phosphopentomutase